MSVLIETSLGDLVIDLLVEAAPKACEKYVSRGLFRLRCSDCGSFLKLCKLKYYNFSPVHSVQKNFSFQSGDPIGPDSKDSDGGSSIWGLLQGSKNKTFVAEIDPKMKHTERGTVSMATVPSSKESDERLAGSQFIITLGENLDFLDGKASIFGKVVEGFDALEKINDSFIDAKGRPLKDIRIRHTVILDDPFDDPAGLVEPEKSPLPTKAQLATVMIADDEEVDNDNDEEAMERLRREREARAQALTLEMVGDLPFAEVKPPENILFVCKLNPVTQDEDLNLIFSRFGKILSCEVIRDKRTGDSLQYAFIEFDQQKDCEQAYFKMQGVLIDDHRIHVDFSQSVSKLSDSWRDSANSKRSSRSGGFGGIDSLERRRQYRGEADRARTSGHGMVFDKNELQKHKRAEQESPARRRSRSPSPMMRDGSRERYDRDRNRRGNGRSDDRYRDDRGARPYKRDKFR